MKCPAKRDEASDTTDDDSSAAAGPIISLFLSYVHSLILCYFTAIMRQLAAILFADMTGYTALMQENEQLARSKRQRLKDVLETTIQKYNGKTLQYYGDGSLSIFNSAIDGVHCAVNMQQQLQQQTLV